MQLSTLINFSIYRYIPPPEITTERRVACQSGCYWIKTWIAAYLKILILNLSIALGNLSLLFVPTLCRSATQPSHLFLCVR